MKIIKKILMFVLILCIGISSIGCTKSKDSGKDTLDLIKEKKTLVLGTAPGFPPFEFLIAKNGKTEVVGSDIDLGKEIAKKMGVKLEVKSFDFNALIPALQSGKVDIVIAGMTPTEKRKEAVDFSNIYYKSKNSLIVRDNFDKTIKSKEDLKKLFIGVQKGSVQEANAKNQLNLKNTRSLNNVVTLVTDLKNSHIEGVLVNDIVAKINEKQVDGIKVIDNIDLDVKGEEENSAVAIKKGNNKKFMDEINKTINDIIKSGEYKKILDKNIDIASIKK